MKFRYGPISIPLALIFASMLALSGCATVPESDGWSGPMPSNPQVQAKLVDWAKSLVGKPAAVARGRRFSYDCTGVVCAVYYGAGIDLQAKFGKYRGNGVTRLHSIMKDSDLLYRTRTPAPGDIIFWDNTYDMNGNGKWDDELTHVGMVTAVDGSGTIDFIHLNYRTGIVIEKMNLFEPSLTRRPEFGKAVAINSSMRMKGQPAGPGTTAGELFRDFGAGYLVP
jgi:hypothetical protein